MTVSLETTFGRIGQLIKKIFWLNLNTFVVCAVVLGLSEDGQKTSHRHLMVEDVFAIIVAHRFRRQKIFSVERINSNYVKLTTINLLVAAEGLALKGHKEAFKLFLKLTNR